MRLKDLMTIGEVSAKVGRTHATIYNWIKAGTFPKGDKYGGSRLWKVEEIEAWEKGEWSEEKYAGIKKGLISKKEVTEITGLGSKAIEYRIKHGKFPEGEKYNETLSLWDEPEVSEWAANNNDDVIRGKLGIKEVCKMTRLTRYKIYAFMKEGGFPKGIKHNNKHYWEAKEIEQWIEGRNVPSRGGGIHGQSLGVLQHCYDYIMLAKQNGVLCGIITPVEDKLLSEIKDIADVQDRVKDSRGQLYFYSAKAAQNEQKR